MHFRSPVTDAATLVPSSNVWCSCQWNQALHEFRLIIHIRRWITMTAHQSGLVLFCTLAAEPYIIELCPLHTQRPGFMRGFLSFIQTYCKGLLSQLLGNASIKTVPGSTVKRQPLWQSLINWKGLGGRWVFISLAQDSSVIHQCLK